jgi:hypothetical protein
MRKEPFPLPIALGWTCPASFARLRQVVFRDALKSAQAKLLAVVPGGSSLPQFEGRHCPAPTVAFLNGMHVQPSKISFHVLSAVE